jgi:hypothetical protein
MEFDKVTHGGPSATTSDKRVVDVQESPESSVDDLGGRSIAASTAHSEPTMHVPQSQPVSTHLEAKKARVGKKRGGEGDDLSESEDSASSAASAPTVGATGSGNKFVKIFELENKLNGWQQQIEQLKAGTKSAVVMCKGGKVEDCKKMLIEASDKSYAMTQECVEMIADLLQLGGEVMQMPGIALIRARCLLRDLHAGCVQSDKYKEAMPLLGARLQEILCETADEIGEDFSCCCGPAIEGARALRDECSKPNPGCKLISMLTIKLLSDITSMANAAKSARAELLFIANNLQSSL